MRYLLISEKPSLMRLVQEAFKKAHMPFEVDFMSLHGHCCTLYSPGDYKPEWEKWELNVLPMIPEVYKHKPVDEKLVKEIKKQLDSFKYDGFINCTDAEREGQNIFYSLYDYLGSDLPVKRFWASDLTDEKLVEAWHNLKDDQNDKYLKNLTNAALLRANSDWLVGMNFSRMVSIINAKSIPIGRVMTVLLAILAKREEEIRNFKPTTTYDVLVDYKQGFSGKLKHEPFKTKEEAQAIVDKLGKIADVQDVEIKTKKSDAPLLYSLGDLQNDANKTYGYSLKETLAIIQNLYEAKILSYPRTDCPYLTTGEAARMSYIIKSCRCVPDVLNLEVDDRKIRDYPRSKYVDDKKVQAHYAIVFTGRDFIFDKLSEKEQHIVTLVAKRIMATLLEPAETTELVITTKINDLIFNTKESVLTHAGWKSLYGEKEKQISIKNIRKGQVLDVIKAYTKDVISSCPARYNDASINSAMVNIGNLIEDKDLAAVLKGKSKDQGGIGTPATRAGILEKVIDPAKGWANRKGKSFYVTEKGLDVYHALKDYSFSSPILTAEWEQKLKSVENGEMTPNEYTKLINEYIVSECENLKAVKLENSLKCPVCGNPMKESEKYFYCSRYKNGCDFILGKKTSGATITEKDIVDLFKEGKTDVKKFTNKEGKKFEASLGIKDGKSCFIFDKPKNDTDIICQCGKSVKLLDGKYGKFYKCDCGTVVNEKVFGRKLSKSEVKKLFAGEKILVEKLKGKSGKEFSAYLKIDENKVKIDSFA